MLEHVEVLAHNVLNDMRAGGKRIRLLSYVEVLRALKRLINACWKWEPSEFEIVDEKTGEVIEDTAKGADADESAITTDHSR